MLAIPIDPNDVAEASQDSGLVVTIASQCSLARFWYTWPGQFFRHEKRADLRSE